ncbi:hypothetical protein RRG08_000547, partial [Elysia crispata]
FVSVCLPEFVCVFQSLRVCVSQSLCVSFRVCECVSPRVCVCLSGVLRVCVSPIVCGVFQAGVAVCECVPFPEFVSVCLFLQLVSVCLELVCVSFRVLFVSVCVSQSLCVSARSFVRVCVCVSPELVCVFLRVCERVCVCVSQSLCVSPRVCVCLSEFVSVCLPEFVCVSFSVSSISFYPLPYTETVVRDVTLNFFSHYLDQHGVLTPRSSFYTSNFSRLNPFTSLLPFGNTNRRRRGPS